MFTPILGIDIAKATLEVFLLGEPHNQRGEFSNNAEGFAKLAKWVTNQLPPEAGPGEAYMEATGPYWYGLAFALHAAGWRVYVLNPRVVKAHADSNLQRNKTDRQDARPIAAFGRSHQNLDRWQPVAPVKRQLREMARHLATLQRDYQRVKNRLETQPESPVVQEAMQRQLEFLEAQIAALAAQMAQHVEAHASLHAPYQLLQTIPGIGPRCAITFLAEVPEVRRFPQASHLAAFAGLTPGRHESGTSVRKPGRLVKWGNAHLRRVLYMPALNAHLWNPIVANLRERLTERGKSKMTVIVACMRKLLHLCYGVVKTGKPFDPNHAASQVTP